MRRRRRRRGSWGKSATARRATTRRTTAGTPSRPASCPEVPELRPSALRTAAVTPSSLSGCFPAPLLSPASVFVDPCPTLKASNLLPRPLETGHHVWVQAEGQPAESLRLLESVQKSASCSLRGKLPSWRRSSCSLRGASALPAAPPQGSSGFIRWTSAVSEPVSGASGRPSRPPLCSDLCLCLVCELEEQPGAWAPRPAPPAPVQ